MLHSDVFATQWSARAYVKTPRACWEEPRFIGSDNGNFFEELNAGAHCLDNWYAGSHNVTGRLMQAGGDALIGFDNSIDRACIQGLPLSQHAGFSERGRASSCMMANFSILSLHNERVMPYNGCRNIEWLVCAAMGRLHRQQHIRLAVNVLALTPLLGVHRIGGIGGYTGPKVRMHTTYSTDDAFYLELCLLGHICTNGHLLFSPQTAKTFRFQCNFSAAKLAELEPLIRQQRARAVEKAATWEFGKAQNVLPHCRRVEVIHIPKTSGQSIIAALDSANVPFCYTETYCSGLNPMPGVKRPCGCRPCHAPYPEAIGVHERRFGVVDGGHAQTLYVSIVRDPTSWLRSAVSHVCVTCPMLLECRTGNISAWYTPRDQMKRAKLCGQWRHAAREFYEQLTWFHTSNIQSRFLDGVYKANNWVICTIESRRAILELLAAAADPGNNILAAENTSRGVLSDKHHVLSANFTEALAGGAYAHLYREDAALYKRVAASPGGCIRSPR